MKAIHMMDSREVVMATRVFCVQINLVLLEGIHVRLERMYELEQEQERRYAPKELAFARLPL